MKKSNGYTMVEILCVIVIIGALAAMVVPRLTGRSQKTRAAVARTDINAHIATALKLYELDTGFLPTTQEGLKVLWEEPADPAAWNGPYLDKEPTDPWGRAYRYASPGVHRPHDYDLYSLGRDGTQSADDVTNWD
jgi:general secretion pathway protein G